MKHTRIQLKDHVTGEVVQTAGGMCGVHVAGSGDQVALLDSAGASATNPVALSNGLIEFYVADTVTSFDLYIMSPTGHFVNVAGVVPGGPNEIGIDTGNPNQVAIIPFSHADSTAATENDTGFELPEDAMISPDGLGIYVNTVDATETIDVGILSTESGGDADGFLDAVSIATAGAVQGEVGFTVGSNATHVDLTGGDVEFTYGVLVCGSGTKAAVSEGADTNTDEGFYLLKRYRCDGTAITVSYTTSAGTDTADGFILIPYTLFAP